ncbi:hypothetical protein CSO01_05430 [Cellulomonas soli]|uniref:Uncharacterized protein n=1 Tax=Cellulomonas soli TaxID=931535 RepID=A0A512P9F0_9CELL|nr:hypothetical protein CSO01_05430 [Cellulomonas soli]
MPTTAHEWESRDRNADPASIANAVATSSPRPNAGAATSVPNQDGAPSPVPFRGRWPPCAEGTSRSLFTPTYRHKGRTSTAAGRDT